jgi:catechol 2,3-dioxygenase-like lactoylglutathione lyase family enzyme
MIQSSGLNHIDLATKDMEATRRFYEDVMGFPLVRADLVEIVGRGEMKHYFFDIGGGQLLGFMSGEEVEGFNQEYDSGINRGLGLPHGVYHFAFNATSEDELEAVKKHLETHDIPVRGPVDHEGWCKSIYFDDPNGLQLEYCHVTRALDADDAIPRLRFRRDGRRKLPAEE